MEVEGEYTFAAPREVVWEYLQDPQVLVKVLPGCEDLKSIGENELAVSGFRDIWLTHCDAGCGLVQRIR